MSPRFQRIDRPLQVPTTGEAIGTGIGWLFVTLALIAAGWLLASMMPALARDVGQWEKSDPVTRSWYKGLMQPDNPHVSCCGVADAYWSDKVEVIDGKVFATITDTRDDKPLGRPHVPPGTRIEVPPHKLKWDRGNPTGHVVVFLGAGLTVLCFVMNGGV